MNRAEPERPVGHHQVYHPSLRRIGEKAAEKIFEKMVENAPNLMKDNLTPKKLNKFQA